MTWDYGRKLFASHHEPDIVGYCGDVLFPTQTLSQIFELIDRGIFFPPNTIPVNRLSMIVDALERASTHYPNALVGDFTIVYITRIAKGMSCTFVAYQVDFQGKRAVCTKSIPIPLRSDLIVCLGSGGNEFNSIEFTKWKNSAVGGTSRSIFCAFAEFVKAGRDVYTGGPPQLVGLLRNDSAKSFGIIWDQGRYLCGMEIGYSSVCTKVEWFNELFEICDPATLERHLSAQRQPNPFKLP